MSYVSHTLTSDTVIEGTRAIGADVLLLGAHAVTDGVMSETAPEVAAVKCALIGAAASKRLLVDASKFRPRTFMTIGHLADLDEVITDDGIGAEEAKRLRAIGVKLAVVSPGR